MKMLPCGWRGRALALVLGLLVAGGVAGQTPPADAKPAAPPAKAAKAAKPAKKPAAPEFKLVLEARAMDLLKATSARLAAAKSMSFTATVGYEYPSKLGPPIVYTTRYDVTMQRPDKLRILSPGDGPASEFYYDGKAMIAYAPAENLVAVADAPPTIDAALKAAFDTAAHLLPVHGHRRCGPVRRADRRGHSRFLHRSVGRGRRGEDRHGGVGEQRRVPADLDRRRRQAAAPDPRDLPRRSAGACATRWNCRTGSSTPRARGGCVRVGEGAGGGADGIHGPACAAARGEAAGQGTPPRRPRQSPPPRRTERRQPMNAKSTRRLLCVASRGRLDRPGGRLGAARTAPAAARRTARARPAIPTPGAAARAIRPAKAPSTRMRTAAAPRTRMEEAPSTPTCTAAAPTAPYGGGVYHTYPSGATAYHPPGYPAYPTYPAYHPPVAVPYYSSGCYGCAAAAGAVVGMAAGAAVASANTQAATSSAYAAGVATGSANTAAATAPRTAPAWPPVPRWRAPPRRART